MTGGLEETGVEETGLEEFELVELSTGLLESTGASEAGVPPQANKGAHSAIAVRRESFLFILYLSL